MDFSAQIEGLDVDKLKEDMNNQKLSKLLTLIQKMQK